MKPLYYSNPYDTEFTARITKILDTAKGRLVFFEDTLFFPEGGGQPADRGTLGGHEVLDVRKSDEGIGHLVSTVDPAPAAPSLEVGVEVTGVVDWPHRYRFMQQHTGQHIVSGALFRCLGINTVSVSLGADEITIETDSPSISPEDIARAEDEANRVIRAAMPVRQEWFTEGKDLPEDLRRSPKVTDEIRVIRIGDFDATPCGGVHAASTDEVKIAFCAGIERIRGNVRLRWVLGDGGMEACRSAFRTLSGLSALFSAPPGDVLRAAEESIARMKETERKSRDFMDAAARIVAEMLVDSANRTAAGAAAAKAITYRVSGFERGFIRAIAEAVGRLDAERAAPSIPVCMVNTLQETVEWVVRNADPGFVFENHRERLLEPIAGKGGGKAPVWQGIGSVPEGADTFLERFRNAIGTKGRNSG